MEDRYFFIKTCNVFIKTVDGESISFFSWLDNHYRGKVIPNPYIKNQQFIMVKINGDSIIEAQTGKKLVLQKDYVLGNGMYLHSKKGEYLFIKYSDVEMASNFYKWHKSDFIIFGDNFKAFLRDGYEQFEKEVEIYKEREAFGKELMKEYLNK
jgi:hypothetical protein